jgi:hypothetical protein
MAEITKGNREKFEMLCCCVWFLERKLQLIQEIENLEATVDRISAEQPVANIPERDEKGNFGKRLPMIFFAPDPEIYRCISRRCSVSR